jgi:hypothetical protein
MTTDPPDAASIIRDRMYPTGHAPLSAKARDQARNILKVAKDFRAAATDSRASGRPIPATSSLHESARLAISAEAALDGHRFRNQEGAHEAVVDYAHATGICTDGEADQLHELRRTRNAGNYPADLVQLDDATLSQLEHIVDGVVAHANQRINPIKKVPAPPAPRRA